MKLLSPILIFTVTLFICSCGIVKDEPTTEGSIAGATQTTNTEAFASKAHVAHVDGHMIDSIDVRLYKVGDSVTFIDNQSLTSLSETEGTYLFNGLAAGNYYIAFILHGKLVGEVGNIVVIFNQQTTAPTQEIPGKAIPSKFPNIFIQISTNAPIDRFSSALQLSSSEIPIESSQAMGDGSSETAYSNAFSSEEEIIVLIEICDDGVDNSNNGFVDCDDPACAEEPCYDSGMENTTLKCSDQNDQDKDGQIDCEDADCKIFSVCDPSENSPFLCSDLLDNNADGLIDCDDPDCQSFDICPNFENTEWECSDGFDNDADGDSDCDDIGCMHLAICQTEENTALTCTDGIDNDKDDLFDCEDPDCLLGGVLECMPDEDSTSVTSRYGCFDGLDNDGDGSADCQDPGCSGVVHPAHPEIICPRSVIQNSDSMFVISKDIFNLDSAFVFSMSNPELDLRGIQTGVTGSMKRLKQMGIISRSHGTTTEYSPRDQPNSTQVDLTFYRFDSVMTEITDCNSQDWIVVGADSLCGPDNSLLAILDTAYEVDLLMDGAGYYILGDNSSGSYPPLDLSYYHNGYLIFDIKSDFDMQLSIRGTTGSSSIWLSDMDTSIVNGVQYGWYPPGHHKRPANGWCYMRFKLSELGLDILSDISTVFSINIPTVYQYHNDKKVFPAAFHANEEYDHTVYSSPWDYEQTDDYKQDSILAYDYWINYSNNARTAPMVEAVERQVTFYVDNIYYGEIETSSCIEFQGELFCD
jgi:hypothetical protein